MARTAIHYKDLLISLLPKGKIWNLEPTSYLYKLFYGLGAEFARIEDRALDLIVEQDVRYTDELITEHEEDFGIPEEGTELGPTIAKRREVLHSALLRIGQQYEDYFIDRAEALGYDITIEEYTPFWAGVGQAGDECGDQENLFYWKIQIDVDSVTESYEVNLSTIISTLGKEKPSHTIVLFDFYNAGFDRGFSSGFNRFPSYDNTWLGLGYDRGFSNGFENNCDYYGVNYIGGFDQGFSIAFDRYSGGGFEFGSFDTGFSTPR